MTEYRVKRPLKRPPLHPGEVLRQDVLPALGLSVTEAAKRLGVSRQQLHTILACTRPITVEMALRLGRLVGNGPGIWLRMQQDHDLRQVGAGPEKRTGKDYGSRNDTPMSKSEDPSQAMTREDMTE